MTVFVRNAQGINVPVDALETDTTANTTATTAADTADTATPTVTNPTKIGAWTTLDRTIPNTMDYSPFTYRGGVDYNKVLSAMYGGRTSLNINGPFMGGVSSGMGAAGGMGGTGGMGAAGGIGGSGGIGVSPDYGAASGTAPLYVDPNKKGAVGSPIAFADEGWNQIIDEARKKINSRLYNNNIMNGGTSLNNTNLDVALLSNAGLTDEKGKKYGLPDIGVMGLSPLEAYGGTDEQKILQQIADKYKVSVNDIVTKDTQLQRALNQYYDPVSANWQDITASPWGKDVTTGVQTWSGLKGKKDADGNTYFDNLNAQLGENPALSAEYFALHGRPEQLGGYKTSGMTANAYKYTGWEDFLPSGVTPLTATPEQISTAANAYNAQSDLLKPWLDPTKYTQEQVDKSGGSYYDLFKSQKLDVPKGYSYRPNAALTRYNQAVNAGVNPEDLGYDASKIYKDALEKDSGGFLGGALGKLAAIASFVPGPIGATARVLSAMNSFSEGNIVGGVTGLAGASGLTGEITNSIGESLMNNFPTELADMAAKFNMTPANFAQMLSNTAVNAGISGVNAGVNGGNIWGAMLAGGSMPLVAGAIDAQLRGVVTNPDLRKFITSQTANAIARTAQGGNILPFDIGSSGGSQQPRPTTTTSTTTPAKEGATKMAGGVEYTYTNGVWVPA